MKSQAISFLSFHEKEWQLTIIQVYFLNLFCQQIYVFLTGYLSRFKKNNDFYYSS